MRIYHAGLTKKVLLRYHALYPERKLNVLFSHGRPNSEADDFHTKYKSYVNSLILDSGTWTLNSSKNKPVINITRETYLDYLQSFKQFYEFYFGFDEDYNKKGFYTNDEHQRFLKAAGLRPIPVIRDIDGEEVDYYINMNHNFLAIGSSEVVNAERIHSIVWRLFKQSIKVHLFGTTRFEYLIDAPVFSCDSSNWVRVGNDDRILFWNEENLKRNKGKSLYLETYACPIKKKATMYMDYEYKVDVDKYLEEELGVTYTDLQGKKRLETRALVNLHYFVKLEELITAYHKDVLRTEW